MFEVMASEEFEAAHSLPGYPGKCSRLHGHSWKVEAVVRGEKLDGLGMLVDFKSVQAALKAVLDRLDHRHLNELPPFSGGMAPTAENLAAYVYGEMEHADLFAEGGGAFLHAIRVWESPHSCAAYLGKG